MTESETRYPQIEKEALASTWVCEKFTPYRIEGNIGGLQLWRILCKSMFDEINFGEFEAPVKFYLI